MPSVQQRFARRLDDWHILVMQVAGTGPESLTLDRYLRISEGLSITWPLGTSRQPGEQARPSFEGRAICYTLYVLYSESSELSTPSKHVCWTKRFFMRRLQIEGKGFTTRY